MKTASGFEFYGGVSKGVEKRTKVRTRIVASALSELIESSDNVMVMGHKNGDLDSIGAAIGARALPSIWEKRLGSGKPRTKPCAAIIEKFEQAGQQDLFLDPARALEFLMRKTLLIVVDTHIRTMLDSEELYNQCKYVAVIDHHRKMVGTSTTP